MIKLWEIVEKEKLRAIYKDMSHIPEETHGLYIYEPRTGPIIVLGQHLEHNGRLHKCVLAEEIGHFYTSPRTNFVSAYTSANLKIIQSQDERKAIQWATDFLIPDIKLTEALEAGCRSCFELAEWFDVTEWFMYRKLGLLKMCFRRTGLKVRGKDLFEAQMQPCNMI